MESKSPDPPRSHSIPCFNLLQQYNAVYQNFCSILKNRTCIAHDQLAHAGCKRKKLIKLSSLLLMGPRGDGPFSTGFSSHQQDNNDFKYTALNVCGLRLLVFYNITSSNCLTIDSLFVDWKLTVSSFFSSRFICSKICRFVQSAWLFFFTFFTFFLHTRSTNMSYQISKIRVTAKIFATKSSLVFLLCSFSRQVCF